MFVHWFSDLLGDYEEFDKCSEYTLEYFLMIPVSQSEERCLWFDV